MHSLRSIVAAVDYSKSSNDALAQAARLAIRAGAELHAVHIIESHAVADLSETAGSPEQKIIAAFIKTGSETLARAIRDLGVAAEKTHQHVRVGPPLEQIIGLVTKVSADLLVVGCLGSSSRGKEIGGLTLKCIRESPSPVLVVLEGATGPFGTVVAAIDFSDVSLGAVREGARVARADGGTLDIVHVYAPAWMLPAWDPLFEPAINLPPPAELDATYRNVLTKRLDQFLAPVQDELAGLTVERHFVAHISAGVGLLDFVEERRADLIVMGNIGRTGIRRVLLGSTAERVLRHSPCSVMTVKPR